MAFCSKCGTQINEGAKFCPKCGQPTNHLGDAQQSTAYESFEDQPEEETIKTWQKVVCVLFWPAGAIITIVAFIKKQIEIAKSALIYSIIGFALTTALNVYLGGCNNRVLDAIEEEVSVTDDVEEAGYNDGYEFGFQFGTDYMDDADGSVSYSARYGAPSTPEEKKHFQMYQRAYEKGFQEGRKAKK